MKLNKGLIIDGITDTNYDGELHLKYFLLLTIRNLKFKLNFWLHTDFLCV